MTRTLRKIGFIDDVTPTVDGDFPKAREHWLCEIVRENLGAQPNRGCFVLRPIKKIENEDLHPLIVGMWSYEVKDGTMIITPPDFDKYWVLSPKAKQHIGETNKDVNAIVINHGGQPKWKRRPPASVFLSTSTKELTGDPE